MAFPRIAVPEPSSLDAGYSEQNWKRYAAAIEQAGGLAIRVPLNGAQDASARLASSCVGVLLPGSGADVDPQKYGEQRIAACADKDPAREAADDLLLQDAFSLHKPIFGICYGLQSLNIWANGTLIQDLPQAFAAHAPGLDGEEPRPNHAAGATILEAHAVAIAPGSRLAAIVASAADVERTNDSIGIIVNSSHHQAVGRSGDQLRVVARSPSDGVIEALELEAPDHFVLGVQWHPERTYESSAVSRALFAAFIAAAAHWRPRPIDVSVAQKAATEKRP